jgi:large subunit ribosomal protein L40e
MKMKIRDQEGIPLEQQFLVINDAEVDDHRTVANYNIDDNSTIHLIRMGNAPDAVVHPSVSMCCIA